MITRDIRREVKLLIRGYDSGYIRQSILSSRSSFAKAYEDRVVNNIYFDSPNLECYYANTHGLSERAKLRLRWYGLPKDKVEKSQVEIKRRHNIYCEKLIHKINDPFELNASWDELRGFVMDHAEGEFFNATTICTEPMVVNRYRRQYYLSFDGLIRVTIDSDLEFFGTGHTDRLTFDRPTMSHPFHVVEIKTSIKHEPDIQEVIKDLPFLVTKSSKYVMGVESEY